MTGVTPNSVSLSWMVPDGQFDSFMVQYKDRDGQPQEVPVAADQREVTILDLDPARKYKMNFYGLHGRRRVGPLSVLAMTGEGGSQAVPSPGYPQSQPCLDCHPLASAPVTTGLSQAHSHEYRWLLPKAGTFPHPVVSLSALQA